MLAPTTTKNQQFFTPISDRPQLSTLTNTHSQYKAAKLYSNAETPSKIKNYRQRKNVRAAGEQNKIQAEQHVHSRKAV